MGQPENQAAIWAVSVFHARRERGNPMLDFDALGAALRLSLLLLQRGADTGHKLIVVKRFLEEIGGADFHGLDCKRNVAVAGNDNYWNAEFELLQPSQQLNATHIRHSYIGYDAADGRIGQRVEKSFG